MVLNLLLLFFILQTASCDHCSLEVFPSRLVVGFGEPVSVSCVASRPVRVLGWESAVGASYTQQNLSVQWKVERLIDWIEEPICYGVFFTAPRQCEEKLNLVLYKNPDSISISLVNHTGAMVDSKEYQLMCEVQNVAPVQYLTLRWYRGQTEVYNNTFSELSPITPVQVSSTLLISPSRAEDGASYSCEATLELGPEGPQPSPRVKSGPLDITVYYPPDSFTPEKEVLEIDDGESLTLNCSAGGNPPPQYSWSSSQVQERVENQPLFTPPSFGTYTCTAFNILGKSSKQFIIKSKSKGLKTSLR
ncbi:vascular cell adhesion protein 1 [Trichomycterus rosablanca]|uniref:vascular cell adhesion protein 1 n=1 Tax=Trichomycterus rosablanca TaxID=2290929 RepID=UPI002F35692B